MPDDKCLKPVWPPKWELMVPMKDEDVNRSLKEMKDEALGRDGRKLKNV